jgi:hypothetical protein
MIFSKKGVIIMWTFIANILIRLLEAFVLSIPWNLGVFIINLGLYKIKKEGQPNNYEDVFWITCISNFIMIFIVLLFFDKTNLLTVD